MPTLKSLIPLVLFAAIVLLGGCEKSKVTEDNFAKLKTGMSMAEVTNILGGKYDDETPPAGVSISGGGVASSAAAPENVYVFKSKDLKIIVTVKNGKVVQTSKVNL